MILNKIEFWLMNNPIRGFIQKYEAKRMRSMTDYNGGDVLEIGCGQGVGTLLIHKLFSPKKIIAMDLDQKMVDRARKKVRLRNVNFQQGDAASLPFKQSQFDAVFDFGILHHVPDWKSALKELHRVLKPKGQVILEDLSIDTFRLPIIGWLMRVLLDHPYKSMYTKKQFHSFVEANGFKVLAKKDNSFWFNMVLEKR